MADKTPTEGQEPTEGTPQEGTPKEGQEPKKTEGQVSPERIEALEKELRSARREAAQYRTKAKELEDEGKSELEKASDRATTAEKRAQEAELRLQQLEVAAEKGLTPAQAKRLVGTTREELEADADELLETFKPADDKGRPTSKPREDLRGGGDPTEDPEETDPRKLAEMVPRY